MLRNLFRGLEHHSGTVGHLWLATAGLEFCQACARSMCKPASSLSSTENRTSSAILKEFQINPQAAAKTVSALPDAYRAHVMAAMLERESPPGSVKYMTTLFKHADRNHDGSLEELEMALKKHTLATQDHRVDTPSREELLRVFTASTLPFVGFGFLDNLIMILAGDYIDATLGSALLLSTMAAAGLGNLISDIAGIFCADAIEERARVFKYGRLPSLSPIQKRLPSVVWVKTSGAIIGITVGCLLGMFPLLFVSHEEGDHHPYEEHKTGSPKKKAAE